MLHECRNLLVRAQILEHKTVLKLGLVARKTCRRGIACINRRCSRATRRRTRSNGVVHAAHLIPQVNAKHARVACNQAAVAHQLGHHAQAAFGYQMSRILNRLATLNQRRNQGICLEIVHELRERHVRCLQVGKRCHHAKGYRILIRIKETAARMPLCGSAHEQPRSSFACSTPKPIGNNLFRKGDNLFRANCHLVRFRRCCQVCLFRK